MHVLICVISLFYMVILAFDWFMVYNNADNKTLDLGCNCDVVTMLDYDV